MSTDISIKYRPRNIEGIVQPAIQRALINAVESGRLLQFYLFSGPRGTGKTSTARWLAATMSCPNRDGHNPCGKCDTCVAVFSGGMCDVIEINAAQYTGKDVMEERVLATINHPPLFGNTKVYILDECHKLSDSAQNSLLKCLEEPPDYAMFIFCTTEPNKVLDTIMDRSIHFEFRPIPEVVVAERLGKICEHEKITIEQGAMEIIARESSGSMRRGMKLLQKMGTTNISLADAETITGKSGAAAAIKYLSFVTQGSFKDALMLVEELRVHGKDVEGLFREVMDVLVDVIRLKVDSPGINSRPYSDDERKLLVKMGEALRADRIRALIFAFERGVSMFQRSGIPTTLVATAVTMDAVSKPEPQQRKE